MEEPERRRPPTVADIARRVGVSAAAVSYALSGRPGVAEHTRRRIRALAEEMAWVPHPAARAVRGRGAGVVGFVVPGPERLFGVDTYHLRLASGLLRELSAHSYDLVLHEAVDVHEAAALYRRWHAERRVDAVFLSTVRYDDPRIEVLNELGLPAVVYSGPNDIGHLSRISHPTPDEPVMADTVRYLAGLGHSRLAYVSGPPGMRYVTGRVRAFTGACRRHAVERSVVAAGNDRGEDAARITRRLLSRPGRPTAVIYNNDVMALAGLAVANELGLDVPAELSIVSWEDSSLLRHTYPPVATISRDVASRGERAAQALLAVLAGEPVRGRVLEPVRLLPAASAGSAGSSPSGCAEVCHDGCMTSIRMRDAMAKILPDLRYGPTEKRVRAVLGGQDVLDTTLAVLVWEPRRVVPSYAVPMAEVRAELTAAPPVAAAAEPAILHPGIPFTVHSTDGQPLSVRVGVHSREAAAFQPADPVLTDYVVLDFQAFDQWYEEDELLVGHPRDPYHRVDIRPSTRHVRVELDGQLLAESRRPTMIFETGLPPRFYVPPDDVRATLRPSDKKTYCAYKGEASYWSVEQADDLAWAYRDPLPEATRLTGLVAFFDDLVDVTLDGQPRTRPATPIAKALLDEAGVQSRPEAA